MTSTDTRAASDVEEIVAALKASALVDMTVDPTVHYDLLDHGLQTAAQLRDSHPDDVELQVAGLLHDIGHVLPPFDSALHAVVGADFVAPVLGERVAELVRLHVPAKRYLVSVEPDYRDKLNGGSTNSLVAQGESMTSEEIDEFAAEDLRDLAIVLRRADESAKVHGRQVDPLTAWVPALRNLAERGR